MSAILAAVVFVPLVGAVAAALVPARARPATAIAALAANAAVVVAIGARVVADDRPVRAVLAGWEPPLGIALFADGASAGMLAMAAVVVLAVGIAAAFEPRLAGGQDGNPAFWPLSLAALAAVNGVFVAADLFTIYVLLELVTLAAVALVGLGGRGAAAPALRYLLVAVTGSLFYLLAVALVYAQAGTLDLALAAERMPTGTPGEDAVLAAILVLAGLGLAAKAALFPFHAWLPVAHPAAPAAVSALLSAVVVKASLFVLWRVFTVLGPLSPATPAIAGTLAALGAVAIFFGGALALRRRGLKTIIAYSTVAQIGYFVLWLPLYTPGAAGLEAQTGGIVLAIAHGLAKSALFLAAGALVIGYGTDRLDGLEGAITRMPATVATIGVAGIGLAGLPPLLGFVGKWELLQSAFAVDAWWWVVVLVLGGLMTFGYIARVLRAMFSPPEGAPALPRERPARAAVAMPFALACASLVLGVFPAGLVGLLEAGAVMAL